jgi:tight adherence protein B
MSGLIISIIPIAVGLLLFAISPEYIMLLFSDKIGFIMLGMSAVMQLMGIYFISKIVKIEV